MSTVDNDLEYETFLRGVWRAINMHQIPETEFTPALISLLDKTKPRLLKNALAFIDPRQPPYRLKEFMAYLQENWDEFNRQQKEFPN